jgi:anti-anti-sigma factor
VGWVIEFGNVARNAEVWMVNPGQQGASAAKLLTVHERDEGDACVVTAIGELDMVSAPRLRQVLRDRLDRPVRLVVVDLDGLSFMGSSGLAVLVEARDWALKTGAVVRVVARGPVVTRPMAATAMDRMIGVFPSVAEALADPVAEAVEPAAETVVADAGG